MANPRLDHVGLTVTDLEAATAFFVALGLEVEGRAALEGEFLDTVIGLPGSRTDIVVLRGPAGGAGVELSRFVRPAPGPAVDGGPEPATTPGLRNVCFEVDDLPAAVARAAADGYGLVGGVGEHEGAWAMAYVGGPDGIVVSLAQRLG